MSSTEICDDNVEEHVCEIFLDEEVSSHGLGSVSRKEKILELTICDKDLEIKQDLSMLNSSQPSTTGAVLWSITPLFCEWVLPQYDWSSLSVLELGCGIAGVLASIIGPKCQSYLATDQRHIIRQTKQNIQQNVGKKFDSISVMALDWELDDCSHLKCDVIIACDTVYNEYLIDPFVSTVTSLLTANPHSELLLAVQLRSLQVHMTCLEKLLENGLNIRYINSSPAGYSIYRIQTTEDRQDQAVVASS